MNCQKIRALYAIHVHNEFEERIEGIQSLFCC
jgi:hypothetical protein